MMMMNNLRSMRHGTIVLGAAALAGWCASSAMAGYETITTSSSGNEPTIADILDFIEDGSDDDTYSLSDVNAGGSLVGHRLHDFNAPAGQLTDQIWANGGETKAAAAAVYWGNNSLGEPFSGSLNQSLGASNDLGTQSLNNVFTASEFGSGQETSLTMIDTTQPFHFTLDNTSSNNASLTADSINALNGSESGIVTFDLWSFLAGSAATSQTLFMPDGSTMTLSAPDAGKSHYIFFADTGASDNDFQDAVWIVTNIHPVPLPAPLALAGVGLIGVAAGRKRLRRMVAA